LTEIGEPQKFLIRATTGTISLTVSWEEGSVAGISSSSSVPIIEAAPEAASETTREADPEAPQEVQVRMSRPLDQSLTQNH